ncbi:hypothetical protein AB0D04_20165 [Streptomyces sp. NPDC048483]|uniref:hypothetical protein n=1 Tax=Streptomyces sp. NPDC048483 TaxID=3154927 RepID=UPI00344190B2
MTIDYGRFAERLTAPWPQRRQLVEEVQREFGYEAVVGTEKKADVLLEVSDVPEALAAWTASPVNSFFAHRGLYETSLQWPPEQAGEHSVFMTEYEGCCFWGYRTADAPLPDPAVWIGYPDDEDGPWEPLSRSVTEWLVQMAVVRVLPEYAFNGGVRTFGTDEDVQGRAVRAALPELGLLPWPETGNTFHFFGARDAIVVWMSEHDAWECGDLEIYGRTEDAVREAAGLLGVALDRDEVREPRRGTLTSRVPRAPHLGTLSG